MTLAIESLSSLVKVVGWYLLGPLDTSRAKRPQNKFRISPKCLLPDVLQQGGEDPHCAGGLRGEENISELRRVLPVPSRRPLHRTCLRPLYSFRLICPPV
jgi:hypothetical protein